MPEPRRSPWLLLPIAALLALWSAWPAPTPWEMGGRCVAGAEARPVAGAAVRQTKSGPHPVATTRTDAYGEFALRLDPGPSTIEIDAPGFAVRREPLPWPMPSPGLHLGEIRLAPARVARLTVTDREGRPVPGLELRVDGHAAVTDEEGRCEFRRIAAGSHPITAHSRDRGRAYVVSGSPLVVGESGEPSEARVTVVVLDSIRGKVVDEDGKQVEEELSIRTATRESSSLGIGGEFELTPGQDLPPAEVQVEIAETQTFEALTDPRRIRWGQEDIVLQVRRRPVGTLSLYVEVVAQATGLPVPGCRISAWEKIERIREVTAPHGKATVPGLRPGWTEFRIGQDDPALEPGGTHWFELGAERTNRLRVELAPREALEVQFQHTLGAIRPWATVVHTADLDGVVPSGGEADEARAAAMLPLALDMGLVRIACRIDDRGRGTVPLLPGVRHAEICIERDLPTDLSWDRLFQTHSEGSPLRVAPGPRQVKLPPLPGRLTGRILPVPEVPPLLVLRRPGVGPFVTRLRVQAHLAPDLSTRPDRFGFFHIENVPPGAWELHPVTSPFGARPLSWVRIPSGASTWVAVDGTPLRAGKVVGRAVLDGVPAGRRTVLLVAGEGFAGQESQRAETDDAGWFTATALPGAYVANLPFLEPGVAWHPTWHGFAQAPGACHVRSGETVRAEFTFQTQSLTLTVHWRDGVPVAVHNAVLLFQEHGPQAIQALDQQAGCTFRMAPWAPFHLNVVMQDGAYPLGPFQLAAGQKETRLELTLPQRHPPWR